MNAEVPRLDRLIALLRMTTADNDNEALMAIRRANEHIAREGWDWDKLLRGKVTIAADPFRDIPAPQPRDAADYSTPRTPPRSGSGSSYTPQPPPRAPKAPPPPPPTPSTTVSRVNKFAGFCYCCGTSVGSGDGFLRMKAAKWEVLCKLHDRDIDRGFPWPPHRAKRKIDVDSIF